LYNIYKKEYHLVLAYQEDTLADVFILDNMNKIILPLSKRNDILVLYTLKTIDVNKATDITTDLQNLSNYKWTKNEGKNLFN
jgi:hypothetical protein